MFPCAGQASAPRLIARMAMVNSRLPFMGFTDDHKFSRLGGRKADEAVKAPIATVLVGRLSAFKL